jgi:transposase
MSTIPTKITQDAFDCHVRPHLSTARRGFECKIALYKVFNYILYWLHTGCQWEQLPIAPDASDPEKRRSVIMRFTTTFVSGAVMVAYKESGRAAL